MSNPDDPTHRRIAAAAILTSDGLIHSMSPPARHHDIVHRLIDAFGHKCCAEDEQGFLLSDGTFCRRKPAKRIATEAGQLLPRAMDLPELYSEDVW